jgi:hypothetical protein
MPNCLSGGFGGVKIGHVESEVRIRLKLMSLKQGQGKRNRADYEFMSQYRHSPKTDYRETSRGYIVLGCESMIESRRPIEGRLSGIIVFSEYAFSRE